MKKLKCEKCNYDIAACNYKKHIKYCTGIGPRKIERLDNVKKGSKEFKNKISNSLKVYFQDENNVKKLSETLKNSDKIKKFILENKYGNVGSSPTRAERPGSLTGKTPSFFYFFIR